MRPLPYQTGYPDVKQNSFQDRRPKPVDGEGWVKAIPVNERNEHGLLRRPDHPDGR